MEKTSEYLFPIFISSTDYNLIDLRAELSLYLYELGYRPILSTAEGFPDSFPDLEPWESCLPVLQTCYVMVLIIDGRYGTTLDWPHYKQIIGERKVSPTHGEYIFAHNLCKRMLVFVRQDVLAFYRSYRTALQNANNNHNEARKSLSGTLPQGIDYETLEFIEEVKTSKPIPWIKTFENVTSIKKEIQKKMLNELAEVFLIKNKHLETVVHAFSTIMTELSPEKRNEILQSIGATRSLIETIDERSKTIKNLKDQVEGLNNKLDSAKTEIEKGKKTGDEKKALEDKVKNLENEKLILNNKIEKFEHANASYFIDDSPLSYKTSINTSALFGNTGIVTAGLSGINFNSNESYKNWFSNKCEECGAEGSLGLSTDFTSRICPKCNRRLCDKCWPRIYYGDSLSEVCPQCRNK